MTPQLFSLEHAPDSVPIWHLMMDDLCNPPAQRVAQVLGLGLRTVQRYNATGYAPRHVCLAIFWLTRWGRSAVNTQAVNDAILMASHVRGLTDHARALTSQIEHLLSIGSFGSANEPALTSPRSDVPPENLDRSKLEVRSLLTFPRNPDSFELEVGRFLGLP